MAVASFAALIAVPQHGAAQDPVEAIQPVHVQEVVVEGAARTPEEEILATAGIRVGDQVTFREIQTAIRRLWDTALFEDIEVLAEAIRPADAESPVRLIIQVEERPFIASVEFRGLESVRARTVQDSANLRTGEPMNPARVAEAQALVRELLADNGIRLRSIDHRVEPIAGSDHEYRLIFDVSEGTRVAIAQLVINGNEAFSDGTLEGVMATKEEGFLWTRPGLLDEAVLRDDLRRNLPEFYGRNGYIDFLVVGDTVIVDPTTGKARLEIEVSEGQQYRLVEFDIRGNRQFASEDLREYYESARGGLLASIGFGGIGAQEGQVASQRPVFNQTRFEQATEDVSQLYRNQGYLYAQVAPVVERTRTEDGQPAVAARWEIVERDPAYINQVRIVGNTRTHENVIRDRIFVVPGDVYSEDMLIQSYRSVMGLGFFEDPLPTPRMEQLPDGDIDIIFEVEEKQTGTFNFGTTLGGWGGLAGFIGFEEPNLFGQAKHGRLNWEFGREYNNLNVSYTDPAIRGSQISGSVSAFSTSQNRFFNFPEGERRNTGASVRFGLPLPMDRRFSRVFLGYRLSRTSYENFGDDSGDIFNQPSGVLSSITMSLLRNTLDSPLFPTVGTRHELRAELSGGPLGGDGDLQKYVANGQWWAPVGSFGGGSPGVRPVRMALGLQTEAGALFGNAESLARFPFEQFWMGGVQYGQRLRGYDETTITPLGYIPSRTGRGVLLSERLGTAYVRMSAEYAVRFNANISVSAFADAGSMWNDPLAINPTRLFRGAGLGLQLVTPFGPMGLDYGYGFDKTDPGWQLHFTFGQQGF